MNNLARHIFLLLFVLSVGYSAQAQVDPYRVGPGRHYDNRSYNSPNPERRVENVKINFIRNRLNLPPDQARRFFPVYQEYQQELFNLRKLKRQNNLNSVDGTQQINRELFYENQIVKVKMKFNDAFLKILPPDKVSELYKSEREFNDELVRQLSERGNGNPRQVPPGN